MAYETICTFLKRFYVFFSKSKKHDFLRFLSCCTRFPQQWYQPPTPADACLCRGGRAKSLGGDCSSSRRTASVSDRDPPSRGRVQSDSERLPAGGLVRSRRRQQDHQQRTFSAGLRRRNRLQCVSVAIFAAAICV